MPLRPTLLGLTVTPSSPHGAAEMLRTPSPSSRPSPVVCSHNPESGQQQGPGHLCISVDVFVESLERVNIELHQLPEEVKVALEHVPGPALTVHNAVENVLEGAGREQ